MYVTIDTREQKPYGFGRWRDEVYVVRDTLPIGDYSLDDWKEHVTVERKSLNDFFQSIGKDRVRFFAEMEAMASYRWKLLVVEAKPIDALEPERHSWTRLIESQVWGSITRILATLQIPLLFVESRVVGEEATFRFLRNVEHQLHRYENIPLVPVLHRTLYTTCSICGKTRRIALKERPDLGIRDWVRIADHIDEDQRVLGNSMAVCYECRELINRKQARLPRGFVWRKPQQDR